MVSSSRITALAVAVWVVLNLGAVSDGVARTPAGQQRQARVVKPAPARTRLLPALIRQNRARVVQAVQQAGGQLEIYKNQQLRLLIDGAGKLVYQKLEQQPAQGQRARTRPVRWWGAFRTFKLATPSDAQLQQRFEALVLPGAPGEQERARPRQERGQPLAILPDGRQIPPDNFTTVYHGTVRVRPELALAQGLPGGGGSWQLKEHAEPVAGTTPGSAFRGATQVVSEPISGNGAAYWAGVGGWVYKIEGLGGWDVNANLYGRVARPVGFRGNLMSAEQEIAIPARVPPRFIKAYGVVKEDSQGRLFVREWIPNPAFVGS